MFFPSHKKQHVRLTVEVAEVAVHQETDHISLPSPNPSLTATWVGATEGSTAGKRLVTRRTGFCHQKSHSGAPVTLSVFCLSSLQKIAHQSRLSNGFSPLIPSKRPAGMYSKLKIMNLKRYYKNYKNI